MTRPSDSEIIQGVVGDLPVGVWVARAPGGEFVYANAAFAEIMGMGARDDVAVGEYATPYGIHARGGEIYPEERLPFVRALREGTTVTVDDIVIHRSDGRRVFIRATAKPVRDALDAISHIVIAFIDISREVEAERARAESEAIVRRKERLESVGQLAGGIAHDFNNLLTVIRGVIGPLRSHEHDPERLADLMLVEEAVKSAASLTRSLLDFSRHRPSRRQRIALADPARLVVGMVGRSTRRIEFALDLAATHDISGDPVMLEQVVMNMVVNACDAIIDSGRVTVRTYDDIAPDGPIAVLEVADTGGGVAPELIDRLFEPYFTTKDQASRRGAGLGLATVFGIVASHGGTVGVAQTSSAGTTLRVTFPALPPTLELAPTPNPTSDPVPGKGLVLVVDDEPGVLAATRRQIAGLGYGVLTASNGAEAIALFTAQRAELTAVILDMNMPGLNGMQVLHALRRLDPAVRVVVVSGYPVGADDLVVIESGNACFVDKPWTAASLSHALASVIARDS